MIFSKFSFNDFAVDNRIAMAPMTRSRTDQPGDVPNDLMATYYKQRAGAGLIITEGAPISAVGRGYSLTPGIYTQEHIEVGKRPQMLCTLAVARSLFSFGMLAVALTRALPASRSFLPLLSKRKIRYLVQLKMANTA